MKIVTLNMRGWGSSAKRRKLSQFLKAGGLLLLWNSGIFSLNHVIN
ncbi:hypothetical protein A2U01_0042531, partial [Trifolium medium]|nr:hypothetical protein [Trifolium medium]